MTQRVRAKMASLLVLIFTVEVAVAVVKAIGAAVINNLVRLPRHLAHV